MPSRSSPTSSPARRAFAALEAFALVLLCAVAFAVTVPIMARNRAQQWQAKDSTQIRAVAQACFVWAGSHHEQFPVPSLVDLQRATVATPASNATRMDTTGNMMSLLIYNRLLSPADCVSPAELNESIRIDDGYEYTNPSGAANPAAALWDPRFSGTPFVTAGTGQAAPRVAGIGNFSYAHALSVNGKRAQWTNTRSAKSVVFANRGPGYQGTLYTPSGWMLGAAGTNPPGVDSITLRIHGPTRTWDGHLAFADGHVTFENRPDPATLTYRRAASVPHNVPDNIFVSETDDSTYRASFGVLSGENMFVAQITSVFGDPPLLGYTIFKD